MTIEIKDARGMRVMLLGDTHPADRPDLWSIHIEPTGDNLERRCLGGLFPAAELLAALDAVPAEKARQMVEDERAHCREFQAERDEARNWAETLQSQKFEAESELAKLRVVDSDGQDLFDRAVSRADRLEAERDALAKTIERVREAFTDLEEGEYDSADCIDAIRAALDPKPAFVLPTEEGGRFEAIDNCGKLSVFRAVADGPDTTYVNTRTWVIWNADIVMSYATDHRLIDAEDGER